MFSIKPAALDDYYDIKSIYEKHGKAISLDNTINIMVAREDGFSGIGVYKISDNVAIISDILMEDDNNIQIKYFICKAILNSIDLKGIRDVYCKLPSEEKVLKMCKFQEQDNKFHLNLTGYFNAPCSHC